jgi:hypothetical protein
VLSTRLHLAPRLRMCRGCMAFYEETFTFIMGSYHIVCVARVCYCLPCCMFLELYRLCFKVFYRKYTYKTLTSTVIFYGCETWSLTLSSVKRDDNWTWANMGRLLPSYLGYMTETTGISETIYLLSGHTVSHPRRKVNCPQCTPRMRIGRVKV